MKKRAWTMGLLVVALTTAGCIEPSRESRRDSAADARCGRLNECGRIGSGETYATFDDCVVEERSTFNDLWPSDECSEGRMNEELYEECLQELRTGSCNENFFDLLSFVGECNAGQVCVDPVN